MGVNSGLPDFRGPQGFWRAYPPYERLGLHFTAVANPRWFVQDPELAWGFYGHRMGLYRRTEPHEGFAILRRWADRMPRGGFVYTSNVNGHFHRGGFDPDRIVEVHGAIGAMQCMADCGSASSRPTRTKSRSTKRPCEPCPPCRPARAAAHRRGRISSCSAMAAGIRRGPTPSIAGSTPGFDSLGRARMVIIELGAGTHVPTIRIMSEDFIDRPGGTLIRINPREPDVPAGHLSLPMGALDALRAIDQRLL